jgi:hypothetical protein
MIKALIISILILSPIKQRKSFTIEIKHIGASKLDTIQVQNIQSPLCIADYQNGESCLICGKDSVITCNVEDYKIINGTSN